MGIIPSIGHRGAQSTGSTSADREESPQRSWNFLAGLWAKSVRIYGSTVTPGQALVAANTSGDLSFSSTLPSSGTLSTTAQTAGQTGTIVAAPASGLYLVAGYIECTTVGAAGTLDLTMSYTDSIGAITSAIIATIALTGSNRDDAVAVIYCTAGGIDYTLTVTGPVGSPKYDAHLAVTKLT